ncbi:3104_t:CDS:2 [Ambispora gerdemannii]|uniref:3104_t:CDS:1 n=1 Tax=Ambispora gerdemannii TaxID=144530 RepID=A0A9N9DHR9_9GLOM|nr:3104_t:CDS:2 [Ambispora gerdemannii]
MPKPIKEQGIELDYENRSCELRLYPNGWFYEIASGEKKTRSLSVRLTHLYTLLNLLKTSLLQQNYSRAIRILEILAGVSELSEITFWQNYSNDPLFLGYFGILAYGMWEQEAIRLNLVKKIRRHHYSIEDSQSQSTIFAYWFVVNDKEDGSIDDDRTRLEKYYQSAAKNLKTSLFIEFSNDIFLVYYVRLQTSMNHVDGALAMTMRYISENPDILKAQWVNAGKTFHRMDPSTPEQLVLRPLCEYYEKIIEKIKIENIREEEKIEILIDAHQNIAELMLQRIEYGDDRLSTILEVLKRMILLENLSPTAPSRLFSPNTKRDTWIGEFLQYPSTKHINTELRRHLYNALALYSGFKLPGCRSNFPRWLNSWKAKVVSGQDPDYINEKDDNYVKKRKRKPMYYRPTPWEIRWRSEMLQLKKTIYNDKRELARDKNVSDEFAPNELFHGAGGESGNSSRLQTATTLSYEEEMPLDDSFDDEILSSNNRIDKGKQKAC